MKQLKNLAIVFLITYMAMILINGVVVSVFPDAITSLSFIYIIQSFHTIVLFGFTPLLCAYFSSDKGILLPFYFKRDFVLPVVVSSLMALIALPCINYFADLCNGFNFPAGFEQMEQMFREAEEKSLLLTESLLNTHSVFRLLLNLFVMAFLPALCEEFFFRGTLQRYMMDVLGHRVAIIAVAILFSLIHFQFFAFLPRFVMGVVLGFMFYYTGSLWSSVFAHFINNALVVFISFYEYNAANTIFSSLGLDDTWYMAVLSFVSVVALLYLLYHLHNISFKEEK